MRRRASASISTSCSGRGLAIFRRGAVLGAGQFAQTGHADGVEFVQVRRRDGQEAHALQQWHARVHGLFQHAPVEGQPRHFAVEKAVRTGRIEIRQGHGRGEGAGQKICRGGRMCHGVCITRFHVGFVTAQAHGALSGAAGFDDACAAGGQVQAPATRVTGETRPHVPGARAKRCSCAIVGSEQAINGAGNTPEGQYSAMALEAADQPVAANRG